MANDFAYETGFVNGFKAGVESAQPKWISVEERLPEENTTVLVALKDGRVFQALYAYDGWCMWEGFTDGVIVWMPLPEPPKED